MSGQTLTGFDSALKDVYGPRIAEQLNTQDVLNDLIEENTDAEEWTGRQKNFPIHVSRNQGVGIAPESAKIPPAGSQGFANCIIPARYNYGSIQLTEQVIKSSQTNKGAFARAMDIEMKGLVRDLGNELERQHFGYGKGVLALVNGAQSMSATAGCTVDGPYGIDGIVNGCRFLNPGMTLVAIDPTTDTTIEATFTVSAVNAAGTVVTFTATQAVTLTTNDRFVRYNSDVAAGTTNNIAKEVMGLLGLIDDATYVNTLHNVNRTTYPIFKSAVISSVGQLSLDVIQRGCDAVDELGGANFGTEGCFISHHSVRREYLKLLQADRRYTGADLKGPDGGTKKAGLKRGGEITYGDLPWKVAKHCPYGTLFGFIVKSITRHVQVKGEWADDDGSILRNVDGYDMWKAFYRKWHNLAMDRPNDGFRLDGITATVAVNHIY